MKKKSRYLQKAYQSRRFKIRKRLCALHNGLIENPNITSEDVKKFIQDRINVILNCGKQFKKSTRLSFCKSVCLCERCGYIKKHDYIKPIAEFMKTENTPLYFFIRKERFVDKSLTLEELEQRIKYLDRQRGKLNRSMINGIAQLNGAIHRIEILPMENKIITCLTSLFISTRPKVHTESDYWKGSQVYDDHPDHKAIRKKVGDDSRKSHRFVISNRKTLKRVINNIFTIKTGLYSHAKDKELIDMLVAIRRRHIWTVGGPIFTKK